MCIFCCLQTDSSDACEITFDLVSTPLVVIHPLTEARSVCIDKLSFAFILKHYRTCEKICHSSFKITKTI